MKKEITFVICVCLFFLAYILDYFAGAIRLNILSPLAFLKNNYFLTFPMTSIAITFRSLAIMSSVALILSIIEKKYFLKLGISTFLLVIAEAYAFQQLATGAKITPITWTLSISYGGVLLLIPMIFYLIAAIANFLIPQSRNSPSEKNEPSILNPSTK